MTMRHVYMVSRRKPKVTEWITLLWVMRTLWPHSKTLLLQWQLQMLLLKKQSHWLRLVKKLRKIVLKWVEIVAQTYSNVWRGFPRSIMVNRSKARGGRDREIGRFCNDWNDTHSNMRVSPDIPCGWMYSLDSRYNLNETWELVRND